MTSEPRVVLPSTTSLRVFEAAARHLTCTGAGNELFMTQSAVSKQIRALEDSLGLTLFVRLNRGLVLTEIGQVYLNEIRPVLSLLRTASVKATLHGTTQRMLTLRVLSVLGDRWLLPKFGAFAEKHPHISVQFTGFLSRDRQDQMQPDGEFLAGDGSPWPGHVADYLFGRHMVLVGAPSLLERKGWIRHPSDLLNFPRLTHYRVAMVWADVFTRLGLELPQDSLVMRYEFYSTLVHGAVAGLGLAMVPLVWVWEELSRGELVNPLALSHEHHIGYYFVIPESKQHDPALAALRAWLIEEAAHTRQHCKEGP